MSGHKAERLLPEGFVLTSAEESEPPDWDRKGGALSQVAWSLDGPDSADGLIFTIFSSAEPAREAWNNGRPRQYPRFHIQRVTELDEGLLHFEARLFNGQVGFPDEGTAGFSSAVGLLGNVLIRATTISSLAPNNANAHGAVALLGSAGGGIAQYFLLQCPPEAKCAFQFPDGTAVPAHP